MHCKKVAGSTVIWQKKIATAGIPNNIIKISNALIKTDLQIIWYNLSSATCYII